MGGGLGAPAGLGLEPGLDLGAGVGLGLGGGAGGGLGLGLLRRLGGRALGGGLCLELGLQGAQGHLEQVVGSRHEVPPKDRVTKLCTHVTDAGSTFRRQPNVR
ncbi:MAG: hypothetical protein H6704_23510 [Myxococcales bacterium]|nr:hypothetical protein [Myxococcales bacterium]